MWSPERALPALRPLLLPLLLAGCGGPMVGDLRILPGPPPPVPAPPSDPTAGLAVPPVPDPGPFRLLRARAGDLDRLDDRVRADVGPRHPALVLASGTTALPALARRPAARGLLACEGARCRLSAPLHVAAGATLRVEDLELVLDSREGALLSVSGRLVLRRARLRAERDGRPDRFAGPSTFRPFLAVHAGGRADLSDCALEHLGYRAPRAYGLVFAAGGRDAGPPPTGTVVRCRMIGLHDGLYARAASHLRIVANRVEGAVRYGIDLFGGTRRVLVADNRVRGSGRHGLVASTRVFDVLFRANHSRTNGGSGLVVHGESGRIAVVGGRFSGNRKSGIAVYEGRDVLVRESRIADNRDHGVRVRNGTRVMLAANLFVANRPAQLRIRATRPGGSVAVLENRFLPHARAEIGRGPPALLAVFANAPPPAWSGVREWTAALARLSEAGGIVFRPDAGISAGSHTMEWNAALVPCTRAC